MLYIPGERGKIKALAISPALNKLEYMNTTEYIASAIERETGISFASLMSAHPILGITTENQRVAIVRVISDGNRQQINAMETALEIVTMLKRWDIFTPVTDAERMEKLEDNYRHFGDC